MDRVGDLLAFAIANSYLLHLSPSTITTIWKPRETVPDNLHQHKGGCSSGHETQAFVAVADPKEDRERSDDHYQLTNNLPGEEVE